MSSTSPTTLSQPLPGQPLMVREALTDVFAHAVRQVRGDVLIEQHCRVDERTFTCTLPGQSLQWPLPARGEGRIIVVGAGKAVATLGAGLARLLGKRIDAGCLIVKHHHTMPDVQLPQHEAGHPLPDASGLAATQAMLRTLDGLTAADRVFVLLTGGASALLVAPAPGISLQEKIKVNELLIRSGADIQAVNTVRRQLSQVKGGGLLRSIGPASAIALLISDVPGNDPAIIGSGPLYPQQQDAADALDILQRHGLMDEVPQAVLQHLRATDRSTATPQPPPHLILGDNQTMVRAACERARALGLEPRVLDTDIRGNTHDCARRFSQALKVAASQRSADSPPLLLIAAGETTLQVRGQGRGGRNQEFALVAAQELAGIAGCAVLAAGSDGTDGPTAAAGGFADGSTVKRSQARGLSLPDCLDDNDSYTLLQQLGDLHVSGPTGTNVMDLMLGLALPGPSHAPTQGQAEQFMFDPKALLEQVLGSQGGLARGGQQVRGRLDQMSGSGGFAGGAAMGGVLGLLLGNKKLRKGAGGLLGYGGAAVVGAMALQAYQNYQRNQSRPSPLSAEQLQAVPARSLPHAQPAADGSPFELVLIRAMVAAAKADGHIDAQEQQRVFGEVERLQLEPDAKAYVFDLLMQPVDLDALGRAVVTPEQAAEVYLAARLAIDPDQAAERAFLDALATRLKLPAELRAQLEAQIEVQPV